MHDFRNYFTPLTAVLFTFPSRYLFTIGRQLVFSLTPWSARIHAKLPLNGITQEFPRRASVFGYGSFTLCGATFHPLHLTFTLPQRAPTTPIASYGFGLFRFRSPLLTESILFLFLRLLRCFTSPGLANSTLCIQWRRAGFNQHRLPHSEIDGSKCICHYPSLIAAYHVLLRLLAPRHPSCALCSLINLMLRTGLRPALSKFDN